MQRWQQLDTAHVESRCSCCAWAGEPSALQVVELVLARTDVSGRPRRIPGHHASVVAGFSSWQAAQKRAAGGGPPSFDWSAYTSWLWQTTNLTVVRFPCSLTRVHPDSVANAVSLRAFGKDVEWRGLPRTG